MTLQQNLDALKILGKRADFNTDNEAFDAYMQLNEAIWRLDKLEGFISKFIEQGKDL